MAKKRTPKKVPLGKPILWSTMPEEDQERLAAPDTQDIELAMRRVVRALEAFMEAELVEQEQ